jgi:hypothetical protein
MTAAAEPAAVIVPILGRIDLSAGLTPVAPQDPLSLPQAAGVLFPVPARHLRLHHRARAAPGPEPGSGVLGASVALRAPPAVVTSKPQHGPRPAPRRTASHDAPPWETLSLILDSSFAPAPAGASAGGAGSGAAGGAAAALGLWLLLQLPGFAYLRLPARQRRPRGRVDDKQTRPG